MGLIDSPLNGATEVPGTSNDSVFVFLAGPIRHWWFPGMWNTSDHQKYTLIRDYAHDVFSEDFLVYAPHRAWRGPWNEVAQEVNDLAVRKCHVFVYLTGHGIVATGTDAELRLAQKEKKTIHEILFSTTNVDYTMQRIRKVHELILKEFPDGRPVRSV